MTNNYSASTTSDDFIGLPACSAAAVQWLPCTYQQPTGLFWC